jgi:hypoxanthine phosphoribosyltransferase
VKTLNIHNKTFQLAISEEVLQQAVDSVAFKMNSELAGKMPLFISILNGAFMFSSDVMKRINFPCNISFVKYASYKGSESTGNANQLFGLTENIEGRTIVILEDIVDTGTTLSGFIEYLRTFNPAEIKIAAMFFKPEACKVQIKIDYLGMEIPNHFVVGYGLDYDGLGRNYPDLYVLKNSDTN